MAEEVELDLKIIIETDLAVLCTDGVVEEWLPKSEIDYDGSIGELCTIIVPEWIAKKKGFI